MTATRHTCTAVLPLPYATPIPPAIYARNFNALTDTGWSVVAPATYAKGTMPGGDWASKIVPVITYTAAGGAFAYTVTGLVAGRTYRVTGTVANVGAAPVIPNVYAGAVPPTLTAGSLAVGATRAAWSDFTPAGTTAVINIGTAALAGSNAGKLACAAVSVYEVKPAAALNLKPVDVSVTLDESWSPYARATLVCPLPAADALPKIDPRLPQRVSLTLARFGAESLTVADLTAMLAVAHAATFNLASSPRATTWVSTGAVPWDRQALTGPGINPPNGVEGGSRFIANAIGTGDVFTLTSSASLPTGQHTASIYLRSSADQAVRVRFIRGAASAFVDVILRAGRWSRVQTPLTVAAAGTPSVTVTTLAPCLPGEVLDITQAMVEAGPLASIYMDGGVGRVGDPAGFPTWTGAAGASTSTKRYGASLASTFTTYFTALSAAYLSDLFADQYNATLDTTLNQARPFDLGLRSRALDYVAGTMTLELAGDEMLLQDYARLNTTDPALVPPAGTSLKALVSWALNLIGTDLDPSASDATIAAADVAWAVGTSLWGFLDPFVTTAGLVLWCDERRRWFLGAPLNGSTGTDNVSALTELDDTLDRDGWGDAVVLANHWSDPTTGQDVTTYAGASVSTTAAYTKLRVFDRVAKAAATVAGATALLNRVRVLGRRVRVAAVCDYTLTPGRTANITTPTTVVDPCMVSAITWSLPADEMTVTTKDLP